MTANEWLAAIGAQSWKPFVSAWLLPPVPLMLITLFGAWRLARRRLRSGWLLSGIGLVGIWLSQSQEVGEWLARVLLAPPPALSPQAVEQMRRSSREVRRVVVVLGGGREPSAAEYGQSHLSGPAMQRLHYAIQLARRIDAPILYSGGVGHGGAGEPTEAETAQRIAERDYGVKLRWLESRSRDTRENARESLAMLEAERGGLGQIVLVSHSWHMPRAWRAFNDAAARWPVSPKIVPAPVGDHDGGTSPLLRWMPSPAGTRLVHSVLRERLALAMGS